MKKTNFLSIILSLFVFASYAQNDVVINNSFENWTSQGSYSDPDGWGTINGLLAIFNLESCYQTTTPAEVKAGSSALVLESVWAFIQTAPGIVATGTLDQNTREVIGGMPMASRPDALTGWYTYSPVNTDTAFFQVDLYKWNPATNSRIHVATGEKIETSTVSSYTQFEVDLTYMTADVPDTAVILFLSSSPDVGNAGSKLILDDLNFNYAPTCEAVTNVGVTDLRSTSVRLNWACEAGIESYNIQGNRVGAPGLVELSVANCAAPFRVNNLPPNTPFFFQVQAVCDASSGLVSPWSETYEFRTLCAVPSNLIATNITPSSAQLTWDAVSGSTSYLLRGRRAGTSNWTQVPRSNNTLNTGNILAPGVTYEWQVIASCAVGGLTAWSPLATFTTSNNPSAGGNDPDCYDGSQANPGGMCTMQYDPVCGCDGNTYSNSCFAHNAGMTSWTQGACPAKQLFAEPAIASSFSVYPNPASDQLSISIDRKADVQIQIVDLKGASVYAESRELEAGESYKLSVSDFNPGIYMVEIRSAHSVMTEKLIIQ